jgi:probable F420-dependent oxidoreductase
MRTWPRTHMPDNGPLSVRLELGIEFGVGYFPTHDGIAPGPLARMVEERGQESLFFAEHTHIPVSSIDSWSGEGRLPAKYWHCLDLFVALTAAAATTRKLRIGSGICLVIERDPIITAKQVASVDHLSGGRFEFGVGAGWNQQEMRNHGTDPRTRLTLMRERIEAMKAIWTQAEASYAGRHVAFERILSYPKPLQRPHPPILVGGSSATVFDRVLAFGDAWFPTYAPDTLERARDLRARAERPVDVQIIGVPTEPAELERIRDANVSRAIHWVPSGPLSVVERALERWERTIADLDGK